MGHKRDIVIVSYLSDILISYYEVYQPCQMVSNMQVQRQCLEDNNDAT